MAVEFEPFQKIARLNRDITITEKLDGTNAAVVITPVDDGGFDLVERIVSVVQGEDGEEYAVHAQSRKRFIVPGDDNYGFAAWVEKNAQALVDTLGPGRHFGEWWGAGIQRKYGLTGNDKRFSLFNTARWDYAADFFGRIDSVPGLYLVPVLYRGPFSQAEIDGAIQDLRQEGSHATDFDRPEGVVIYHRALNTYLKVTLEGDEAPKGAAGHALDEEVR